MADTVERENLPKSPDSVLVTEIPDTPEVPVEMQKSGVQAVPGQFKAVLDDTSQQSTTNNQQSQTITVSIPASQQKLSDWAKGPDENALTWFAKFWLRMIQKAVAFGWRIVASQLDKSRGTSNGTP